MMKVTKYPPKERIDINKAPMLVLINDKHVGLLTTLKSHGAYIRITAITPKGAGDTMMCKISEFDARMQMQYNITPFYGSVTLANDITESDAQGLVITGRGSLVTTATDQASVADDLLFVMDDWTVLRAADEFEILWPNKYRLLDNSAGTVIDVASPDQSYNIGRVVERVALTTARLSSYRGTFTLASRQ